MWVYHIETGVLEKDDKKIDTGYSGSGKYKNNPKYCFVRGLGPIPKGSYTIGSSYHHPDLGPIVMNLQPDPNNIMYGRSLFRIHGDSIKNPGSASHGCIILSEKTRVMITESNDKELKVVL